MDMLAVATRFGSYAALSLIAGIPLFLWLSLGAARARAVLAQWRGGYGLLLLAGAALAVFQLLIVTAGMAGAPLFPVDWEMVSLVLSATASGKAILARACLLLLMLPLLWLTALRPVTLIALLAAATLGWSGHAAAGEGMAGWTHFLADIFHIVAAALWIGGMACLLLSLRQAQAGVTLSMLHAFALIGGITVALLIATGIINGVMIIGLDALPAALGTVYGRLLALKLVAFTAMLVLAANNRFRLTPAFERQAPTARAHLRRAVAVEIGLAFFILLLVGWLGMIDPSGAA